jgi:hypothetical protein
MDRKPLWYAMAQAFEHARTTGRAQ